MIRKHEQPREKKLLVKVKTYYVKRKLRKRLIRCYVCCTGRKTRLESCLEKGKNRNLTEMKTNKEIFNAVTEKRTLLATILRPKRNWFGHRRKELLTTILQRTVDGVIKIDPGRIKKKVQEICKHKGIRRQRRPEDTAPMDGRNLLRKQKVGESKDQDEGC